MRGDLGDVPSENLKLISVLLLSSIHVSGHIFETRKTLLRKRVKWTFKCLKAHCKNLPFFIWLHVSLLFRNPRLHSVLHTSPINVRWTWLSTADVAFMSRQSEANKTDTNWQRGPYAFYSPASQWIHLQEDLDPFPFSRQHIESLSNTVDCSPQINPNILKGSITFDVFLIFFIYLVFL